MYPDLFGINDLSYALCELTGILIAFAVACLFLKKKNSKKNDILDLLICGCFAIVFGIIFAILFENLYEVIELKDQYKWVFKMTFFGGLFGGVLGFLGTYFILYKRGKTSSQFNDVVIIAPASIVIAHSIGRIGCFLAGCCYGKHTDSWIGMNFPGLGKVIPTQLIESIFLFVLFIILIYAAVSNKMRVKLYLGTKELKKYDSELILKDKKGIRFAYQTCLLSFAICIFSFILDNGIFLYKSNKLRLESLFVNSSISGLPDNVINSSTGI